MAGSRRSWRMRSGAPRRRGRAPWDRSAYNANVQIFQTRDHVVILQEQIHEARIVPLDGRPHAPGGTGRLWLGDARVRWEGNTLVHEGNVGLRGILAGARQEEKEAAQSTTASRP